MSNISSFNDKFIYEPFLGMSSTKEIYGTPINVVGKFEVVDKLITSSVGDKVNHATGFKMTDNIKEIKVTSRITFNNIIYEVISSEPVNTHYGFHHLEVYMR